MIVLLLYYAVAAQSPADGHQCSAQGYSSKIVSTSASDMTARSRVISLHYPYSWRERMTGRGR